MWNDILALLKQELVVSVIIFILLFVKVGATEWKADNLLITVNVLLVLNFLAGLFGNFEGLLFNGMFDTNNLVNFEKNLLNLATLIISLQSYNWLRVYKHIIEFYVLLLSTLLGMFFYDIGKQPPDILCWTGTLNNTISCSCEFRFK